MMRFVAALALALCCLAPLKADPIYQSQVLGCSHSAPATGTIGTTKLVEAVTGQGIYICGFTLLSTTASGTAKLVYGTKVSTDCDTGQTALTPVFTFGAIGQSLVDPSSYLRGMGTPASQQLCIVTATGAVTVIVYYSQF